jgi:hypothetical protein
MAAYLTIAGFKNLSVMPATYIDAIETQAPGWLDAQLAYWSGWIDSRLRKRYAAPFSAPYPQAVQGWLARIVTERAWLRRGVNPQDEQWQSVHNDAEEAKREVLEAANGELGLFELPLRGDTNASGLAHAFGHAYSEASPYVSLDGQARTGRREDSNRGGTGG